MKIHQHRKNEHLSLAEKFFKTQSSNQLDEVQLIYSNLPELNLSDIDIRSTLVGKDIPVPFFINAITGGSPQTDDINYKLATVAAKANIPMACGSQSIALKYPSLSPNFSKIRQLNPNGFLLGNLGAGHSYSNFNVAQQMIDANAMELHLNVSQELVMPEGDTEFMWKDNIREIVNNSSFPLLVKGVGQGLTPITIKELADIGVKYIDLSGKGGTNFIEIENRRRKQKELTFLQDIGMTTAQSLVAAKLVDEDISFTASGGIRNSLDIVKCLVLGADNVGISGLFLHILLRQGTESLIEYITNLKVEIKKIMLMLGCKTIDDLHKLPVILSSELLVFKKQMTELLKNKGWD